MNEIIKNKKLYVNDDELVYEIILSKGRGILSLKAKKMFINIVTNFMWKFKSRLDEDQQQDCFQNAILQLLLNWKSFNTKKYSKALPYFTEMTKRAITWEYNELKKYKHLSLDMLDKNKIKI